MGGVIWGVINPERNNEPYGKLANFVHTSINTHARLKNKKVLLQKDEKNAAGRQQRKLIVLGRDQPSIENDETLRRLARSADTDHLPGYQNAAPAVPLPLMPYR